jgi:hypothetical protein
MYIITVYFSIFFTISIIKSYYQVFEDIYVSKLKIKINTAQYLNRNFI